MWSMTPKKRKSNRAAHLADCGESFELRWHPACGTRLPASYSGETIACDSALPFTAQDIEKPFMEAVSFRGLRRMKFVALVLIVVAIAGAYLVGAHQRSRADAAPIVFVSEGIAHAKDIWQSCPSIALSLDEKSSEYRILMGWRNGRWDSLVIRGTSVLLMKDEGSDFNQLVREACRAITPDAATWLPEYRKRMASAAPGADESDRYEIRELRDSSSKRVGQSEASDESYESVLLDKRTGRVWKWSAQPNSFFVEAEVTPSPRD